MDVLCVKEYEDRIGPPFFEQLHASSVLVLLCFHERLLSLFNVAVLVNLFRVNLDADALGSEFVSSFKVVGVAFKPCVKLLG